MDTLQAIERRHSVRKYEDQPIQNQIASRLQAAINVCNRVGGLNMQLVRNEPEAFGGLRARVARFSGVSNYIAVIGEKSDDLDERAGYYGEKVVLVAQQMHLNTCWVGVSYKRVPEAYDLQDDEKLVAVIAVGYGTTQGEPHKGKSMCDVSDGTEVSRSDPDWYKRGVVAALMAPTAMNRQRFYFRRNGREVSVAAGRGPYAEVDLGIVKCHFEIGAGKENFDWVPAPEEDGGILSAISGGSDSSREQDQ